MIWHIGIKRVVIVIRANLSFRSLRPTILRRFAKDLSSLLHKIYDTYIKLYQKVKYFLES